MKYKVAIRKNSTGEIRLYDLGDIPWGESSEFWWTEGNMSCDCNRQWDFERAGGDPITEDPDPDCGDIKYSALYAELEDGTRIPLDEE